MHSTAVWGDSPNRRAIESLFGFRPDFAPRQRLRLQHYFVVVLIQHERALRSHCPYNLVTIAVKEFLLAWLELPFASCALNPRSMKQTGIMLSGSSKTLRVSSGK